MPETTTENGSQHHDLDAIKNQLRTMLKHLTREDLFVLGDFIFEEARSRTANRGRAWRYRRHSDQA